MLDVLVKITFYLEVVQLICGGLEQDGQDKEDENKKHRFLHILFILSILLIAFCLDPLRIT